MKAYLRQVRAILWKDLVVELRTRQRLSAMGAFTVLVGILFNFALDPTAVRPEDVAAGLVWITILFGGLLGVGRTFSLEDEEAAFQGVLASPAPRTAVFLAKVASNFVLLVIVVLLVLGVFSLFFDLRIGRNPVVLAGVVGLGVVGFVALATLFSAISHRTSMGETLLPVLVFPLLVPVVIYGVSATSRVFAGRPATEVAGHLRMLGAFALLAVTAGALLFRFAVEE